MRVLVGCERSQVVAKAFIERGHEVLSCDLEPSANPLPNSGYPLTHEETEAMLAECPPKSAPAGTGVNSPKTDTGD